jgi:hypothetical protein
VTKAGEYIVPVVLGVVAVFGALALAVAACLVPFGLIIGLIGAQVAAVAAAGAAILYGFVQAWHAVTGFLDSITLSGVGTAIMQGLANGIAAGAGIPLEAITGAVKGAIAGAKNLLGIHSPSRVFAEIGGYTAEGFAQGIDEGAPEAQTSLASMVSPLSAQDALSGNAGGSAPSSGGASSTSSVSGNTFNFYGVEGAEDALDKLREQMTLILEGDAASAAGAAA